MKKKNDIWAKRVNELCKCKHKRSQHSDTFANGHGYCKEVCSCEQFTWICFLDKDGKKL